jgi:phosphate transport system substrate-binding protein
VASGAYPLFVPLYLVTNPSSPNAAAAKEFVDFTLSAKGAAALRARSLVPYDAGSTLIAMDASRRSQILAQVGAHASAEPTQIASAPSRTVAPAAVAAARPATPATPALNKVSGAVVAAPQPSSLKGVRGDAFTELAAAGRGSNFAKVTSDAYVSVAKTSSKTAAKTASKAASIEPKAEPKKKIASVERKPARSYRVAAGETLYSIARKHGVDVAQIRTWNHLKDNTVRTGQVLRIETR